MTVVAEIHLIGADSEKPAASAANNGYYWTSTDVAGGTTYRSNGSSWVQIAAGASGSHAAVTLSANAGSNLLALSGQEIGIDNQDANKVFAGPTTGAAVAPAFRALVATDLGTGTPDNTQFLRDDLSWQPITAPDVGGIPIETFTAEGDLLIGTGNAAVDNLAVGTAGYALISRSNRPAYEAQISTINVGWDNGETEIADNTKIRFRIGFDCTIVGYALGADQTGSIVLDIWKGTQANYPPTITDTITAAAKPTLSGAITSTDTTLTGWTTTVAAGDWLILNVDSCTTITAFTLSLDVRRA